MSSPAMYEPVDEYGDDEALVRAHRAGNDEAFDVLFRRYYHQLVSWIEWRCHDHARAEDIAQETFAAVIRYIATFDSSRPIWPWLRTIAGHLAGREARAVGPETPVEQMPDGTAFADVFDGLDDRALVASAMSKLSRRHQTALWLKYAEERRGPECASMMNISANGFNQLVWRARRLLRDELEAMGRGAGALVASLAFGLRRLSRRATLTRVRYESAAGLSANFASLAVTVAGALAVAPTLLGAAPEQAHTAARLMAQAAVADVHVLTSPRPSHLVVKAHGHSVAVHRAVASAPQGSGDVTVDAGAGGSSSHLTVAKNPVRSGKQVDEEIIISTPAGNLDLGADATGGQYRMICNYVSCG